MTICPLRWLHLSDFHVGADHYAQKRLFDKIIEHVKEQVGEGFVPDLVFITGDIANKGGKDEYQTFRKEFYIPLEEALGGKDWQGRLYAVPGNHDVARPVADGLNRQKLVEPGSRFFDPDKTGKAARDQVVPRFKHYKQLMPCAATSDWVAAAEGAFADKLTIKEQSVGIVGLNTAWLSMDNQDKSQLTPGIPLAEAALAKIKDCQVRIVLGHHPLHWLIEEHITRLRSLFGKHRVIYLHGHMHKAEGRREEGAGEPFLAFQAGAAFQARDDEIWRNGLLWGELDIKQGELRLNPRFWNPDNYDWPPETGRFPERLRVPGSDWWAYPLPTTGESKTPPWPAPPGWAVLDRAALDKLKRDITPEEAGRFFDGVEPEWALAQCPALPKRAIVGQLAERLAKHNNAERPLLVLLTGPGGEGKSMAWRQAVVALFEREPGLRLLWREDETATLSAGQLQNLPTGPWLIATDAADLRIRDLHGAMQTLARQRPDLRFLLAARDSDWRAGGGESLDWRGFEVQREVLSGLSQDDAGLITEAWRHFHATDGLDERTDLARRLFEAAQDEAKRGDGALLGGVLVLRKGDGLRAHVHSLLNRLAQTRLTQTASLRDALGYIAAMDAEGLDFLSRPVLAEVLECKPADLSKNVLFPLGREAAASGGTLIHTRHRRIAALVIDILREEFGEDVECYYVTLARAAKVAWQKGNRVPTLTKWEYDLPKHFADKKHHEPAIAIARAVLEQDAGNAHLAVSLAKIYRRAGEPAEGAGVLRDFRGEVGELRGFWYEWGTCAGGAGNKALSAWLGGWSLADQTGAALPGNDQAKLSLAGLGVAFAGLYEQYHDRVFLEARHAIGQLGLRLRLDATTRGYFERYLAETEQQGIAATTLDGALARLRLGLQRAWECSAERDSFLIPKPQAMQFEGLRRLFSADQFSAR